MAFRYQAPARRRALGAGLAGIIVVSVSGPTLTVPAIALVALVYYAHQVAAALAGDSGVAYPSLAFVIALNSMAILVVQALVFLAGLRAGP